MKMSHTHCCRTFVKNEVKRHPFFLSETKIAIRGSRKNVVIIYVVFSQKYINEKVKKEGSPSPITVALLPSSQLAFGREDSRLRLRLFFRGKIKATFFGFAWIWVSHPTQYKNFPWVSHDSPLYWMLPCYSSTYERNETNLIFLSCIAERFLDEISHAKKLDNNEDDEQIFTLLKVLWEFSSFSDGSLEQPPLMKIIVRQQS